MKQKTEELIREENLKEELDNILDEIDTIGLLDGNDRNSLMSTNRDITLLDELHPNKFMNFDKIKEDSDIEAKEIVDSIVGFYIKDDMNDEQKGRRFLHSKMKTDSMTVSNLLFQMKTAEHAIKRLLEEIDSGNLHPRQFEVLASLQKSKMDIIKHLSFVQIQMENNYKTIRQEQEHLYDITPDEEELRGGFGSKGILKRLKDSNPITIELDDE